MKDSLHILLEKYQMRKTKKQKGEFADWLKEHLSGYGYEVHEEKYSDSGTNWVIGQVASAKVVLTAHYDTPPDFFFPLVMGFSNWVSFLLSQVFMLWPIGLYYALYFGFFASLVGGGLLSFFFTILPVIYSVQILCGAANRHTANDNTSGVATLISILEELPEAEREKICVVFFDQEELGLVGSKHFYGKYRRIMANKPLINFDCVSDGDTLTFVMKKKFKESSCFDLLTAAAEKVVEGSRKTNRFADAFWNIYCSDQLFFPCGVGVVAAKKAPFFGYYIHRIHSCWDTQFDHVNIELLTNTMLHLIGEL